MGLMQVLCWWVLDCDLEDVDSCKLHIEVESQLQG